MTLRYQSLLFTLVVMAVSPVLAQNKPCVPKTHAKLPVITDMPYPKARKALIANGWQPQRTRSAALPPEDGSRVYWDSGYTEVQYCSGTGSARCGFLFGDAYGNRLEITTEGMNYPNSGVAQYSFRCD
jgi:hypothetical protein